MPQTRSAAEAFGAVTITLVSVFALLTLLSILYTVHFRLRIRKQNLLQLGFFNGPWATRIVFSSIAIWWGIWEVIRLSLLRSRGGSVSANYSWQKHTCKLYIISNVGVAEPTMLFILVFLLRASLQKREFGALSHRWNGKTICWAVLLSLPLSVLQLGIIFLGPKVLDHAKLASYFWRSWSSTDNGDGGSGGACTYPLFSTVLLGLFDLVLLIYASYAAARILALAVNRRLRQRIGIFILLVDIFILLRVVFLGLSVLPVPGSAAFEALVFLAFLVQLLSTAAAVLVLVFFPAADSLALRGAVGFDLEEVPFDDYYGGGASLIDNNQSPSGEPGRSSDVSTKRGSISFRTMIKMDLLIAPDSSQPPS